MEHRTKQRKHVFLYLDVYDQITGQLLGHLGDISNEGLMIIANQPLPLHLRQAVRVKLPEGEFSKSFIDLDIETRWTAPDVNPDLHCIGCLFVEISPEDEELVDAVGKLLSFDG